MAQEVTTAEFKERYRSFDVDTKMKTVERMKKGRNNYSGEMLKAFDELIEWCELNIIIDMED